MPKPLNLYATLGEHMLRGYKRDAVVSKLAASAFDPATRRRIYRAWCVAVGLKPRLQDLDDVAPPRSKLPKTIALEF